MSRPVDPQTRPALLQAARELFYARGIAAIGVDEIARASGKTKPTLYRHFPSKDVLIDVYLDERDAQLDKELLAWIDREEPPRRPWSVIEWVCDWISRPGFNGCAFLRASAELPDDAGTRMRAKARKQHLVSAIEAACRDAGANTPGALARQLALIVEGATTMAFITGDAVSAAAAARSIGRAVLGAAEFDAR